MDITGPSREVELSHYYNKALKSIGIFNPKKNRFFYKWLNEFECIASMIEVPENIMAELFISLVADDVKRTIMANNPAVNVYQQSYDEILSDYLKSITPYGESYFHRYRLNRRFQYLKEPLEKFVHNLRRIIIKCNYNDRVNERLCRRFVEGLFDNDLKTYLKSLSNLTFEETFAKAVEYSADNLIKDYVKKAKDNLNIYNSMLEGEFYVWLNRFEYVADLIKVKKDQMVGFFNAMVNKSVHLLAKKANPDVNFLQLPYEELIKCYHRTFDPLNPNDLHKKRFSCRNQYEGETIDTYAIHLQKIYDMCENSRESDQELCERFIDGIIDERTRIVLRNMPDLPFEGLVIIATSHERLLNSGLNKIQNQSSEQKS